MPFASATHTVPFRFTQTMFPSPLCTMCVSRTPFKKAHAHSHPKFQFNQTSCLSRLQRTPNSRINIQSRQALNSFRLRSRRVRGAAATAAFTFSVCIAWTDRMHSHSHSHLIRPSLAAILEYLRFHRKALQTGLNIESRRRRRAVSVGAGLRLDNTEIERWLSL